MLHVVVLVRPVLVPDEIADKTPHEVLPPAHVFQEIAIASFPHLLLHRSAATLGYLIITKLKGELALGGVWGLTPTNGLPLL